MRNRLAMALLACLFLASCAKDLVTGKTVLNYYSLDSEPRFGEQVMSAQLAAAKKSGKATDAEADAAEFERLQRIVKDLAAETHNSNFPYEVHLVDIDVANAWCAPGGKIMVYTGLWDEKKGLVQKGNDDELAAVLAHEMAHANARHVTEAISRTTTISIAGAAVQTAIGAGGYPGSADTFGQIFSNGMSLYVPGYSRQNEYEADALGIMYMARAGYDPKKAVDLWYKAAQKKKDHASIFASHPSNGARAERLEQMLPAVMPIYEESKSKGKGPTVHR